MNRQQLVDMIADKTRQTKVATGEQINAVLEVITGSLVKGDTVRLTGFGSFTTGARAARTGRNPRTGEEIRITATRTVKFAAGQAFRGAVNKTGIW